MTVITTSMVMPSTSPEIDLGGTDHCRQKQNRNDDTHDLASLRRESDLGE